jgi:hypothetical protein
LHARTHSEGLALNKSPKGQGRRPKQLGSQPIK